MIPPEGNLLDVMTSVDYLAARRRAHREALAVASTMAGVRRRPTEDDVERWVAAFTAHLAATTSEGSSVTVRRRRHRPVPAWATRQ
jgi:hypothetical protein